MGFPIAQNLLKAGHTLTVYNRTASKAEPLCAQGASVAPTPAEACHGDVVFTMLADDRALLEVLDNGKLLQSFGPKTVHVSLSTISVALAQQLEKMHRDAGKGFVSAPVFGRPDAAAAAKLAIIVAGDAELAKLCEPLFSAIGQRTFHFGYTPHHANIVKICGNFLISSMLESLGEAMALSRKCGVDPLQFLDAMTSSIFPAPIYQNYGRMVAQNQRGEPAPAGFALPLGLKDVRLTLAVADDLNVPMPVACVVHDHMLTAMAQGMEKLDWSAFTAVIAKNAGL